MKKVALFIALISTGFSQDFLNPLMSLPAEDFFNPEKRNSVRQTFLNTYKDWLKGDHHSHQKNEEHFGDKASGPLKFILQLGRYTATLELEEAQRANQLPNLARAITFAVAGHVWPIKPTPLQDEVRREYVAAVMNACNIIDFKTDDITQLANNNQNIAQEPAHFDAFSRIIVKTKEYKEKANQPAAPQERYNLIGVLKAHWFYEKTTYDTAWIDKAIETVYAVYADHIRDDTGLNYEIFGGLTPEEAKKVTLPIEKENFFVIPHKERSHRGNISTANRVGSMEQADQTSAKDEAASKLSPESKPEPSSPASKNTDAASKKHSHRGRYHAPQAATQPRVTAAMVPPEGANRQVAGQEAKKATK